MGCQADTDVRRRVQALSGELVNLLERAGIRPEIVQIAQAAGCGELDPIPALALVGDAAKQAVRQEVTETSFAARWRVESLMRATSLARLLRLHIGLHGQGGVGSDQLLGLAERLVVDTAGEWRLAPN